MRSKFLKLEKKKVFMDQNLFALSGILIAKDYSLSCPCILPPSSSFSSFSFFFFSFFLTCPFFQRLSIHSSFVKYVPNVRTHFSNKNIDLSLSVRTILFR